MEALSNTRIFKLFLMLWLLPLGACTSGTAQPFKTLEPDSARTSVSQPTATATEAQPTPTAQPTAAPRYQVNEPAASFTEAQTALNESPEALAQKDRMQRWLDYWIQFENRPFVENSQEMHWKYIYDDPNQATEVMVMLEAGGEYGGKLYTVPIGDGALAEFPPEVEGEFIEENYGPLELTAGAEGQWLAVEKGIPVRKDTTGVVVEKLNMKSRLWEEVEATSVTFSEKYPVLWSEGYTANVGGMEIPIDIGLTYGVVKRIDEPISEIHIAEDMVDNFGEYFMHMCFWRYTKLMDHPDVTYEQYELTLIL